MGVFAVIQNWASPREATTAARSASTPELRRKPNRRAPIRRSTCQAWISADLDHSDDSAKVAPLRNGGVLQRSGAIG